MPQLDYLDTDKKFIDFTKNNIDLINFCISVDSSYRNAFNEDYEGSSAELIKKHWKFNETSITKICQQIDKENSTHLAVSGHKKNPIKYDDKNTENNQGVKIVVDKIIKINNFENELKKSNPKLVDIIADAVDGISKFSFASKFCTYVSRYKDGNDNAYSIYDKVISEILPYYEWKFLGTMKHIRRKQNQSKEIVSTIEDDFANKENGFKYNDYNTLVGQIIEAVNKEKNLKVDRLTFDRMLWYYYKGDEKLRQDALNEIPLQY